MKIFVEFQVTQCPENGSNLKLLQLYKLSTGVCCGGLKVVGENPVIFECKL